MMGWGAPEQGWRKGPWNPDEDKLLSEYVNLHGEGRWSSVARCAGLNRSGKSCRLRWVNYLRPGLKRGVLTPQEEGIIIELYALWGNRWSTIARYLPGRTDNEIKNYWRTHFKKNKRSSHQKQEKRKAQILDQKRQHKQQHRPALLVDDIKMVNQSGVNMHGAAQDGKQEMPFMCPTLEGQCFPVMSQDTACSWEDSVMEDGLWGGLWNLEDDPLDHTSNCNKIATKNQGTDFPFAGDSKSFYSKHHIF